ncbi:hypothetical protein ElyMa_000616400 [Elysia marginata]|uniref:MULE transposase domain-containing protein n=1 Tax=Elysia marginata TaxID=1093978 RepID=A0AAV4G8X1_9GAST|nr:hypothetical protein ElyMa_000616400 [Elysia marginata]
MISKSPHFQAALNEIDPDQVRRNVLASAGPGGTHKHSCGHFGKSTTTIFQNRQLGAELHRNTGAFHLRRFTSELGNTGSHLRGFFGTYYGYRREAIANLNIWRCVKKDCKAILTTNEDDALIIGEKNIHNHDPESEEDILRLELKMKSRKRALVEKNEPPSKVIIKEVTEMASENQDFISAADTKAIRQAVYRERRKIYPTLPKSLMEAQESIEKVGFLSSAGENMVCLNDKVSGIVLFGSKSGLKCLCDGTELFGDGTFNYAAAFFTQMYTLHACIKGVYVPCVYTLLPSKEKKIYLQMFKSIVDACKEEGFTLKPTSLNLDFESAVHDYAREVWPTINIKGCLFHLGQNWWRQIQKLGLI